MTMGELEVEWTSRGISDLIGCWPPQALVNAHETANKLQFLRNYYKHRS